MASPVTTAGVTSWLLGLHQWWLPLVLLIMTLGWAPISYVTLLYFYRSEGRMK